jgi:hypothetical protein
VPAGERTGGAVVRLMIPERESFRRRGKLVTVLARAENALGVGPWAIRDVRLGE